MKKIAITAGALALLLGFAGVASAQTPGLTIGVAVPQTVEAGAARTLAVISLQSAGGDVILNSLPVSIGFSELTPPTPLSNCSLKGASGTAVSVTMQGSSGLYPFQFAAPLTVAANSTQTLSLVCDVSAQVRNGSAIAVNIKTANVAATSGGGTVAVGGVDDDPTPGIPGGIAMVSSSTNGGANGGNGNGGALPNTPGVPNTGAGGEVLLWSALLLVGLMLLGGGVYLASMRRT